MNRERKRKRERGTERERERERKREREIERDRESEGEKKKEVESLVRGGCNLLHLQEDGRYIGEWHLYRTHHGWVSWISPYK